MLLFLPYYSVQYWTGEDEYIRFSYIIKCNLNLVDKSVFHILDLPHSNEINNKREPEYYCLLYMIRNTLM
jgi:hypothetical protein